MPSCARGTPAASSHETEYHVIARLDIAHPRADLLHDASTLVAPITGFTDGRSPVTRCSSEWHIPDAASRTSTSPV